MNDKQTLTLKAGKYYRTRNGRKAYIAGRNPFATTSKLVWTGFLDNSSNAYGWMNDGHYRYSDGHEDENDLVAEWVEPKRIKGWVNVYPGVQANRSNSYGLKALCHLGHVYQDRKEAYIANAAQTTKSRIACIEIDTLEGAGLWEVA